MNLSTPMDDDVVGEIVAAWKRALGRMSAADLALASRSTVTVPSR